MRIILVLFLMCFSSFSNAQTFNYPVITTSGKNNRDFVPAGWTILDSAAGDLNKDGVKDAAIVLQLKDSVSLKNRSGEIVFTKPRILLLLFKNPAIAHFELVEKSHTLILNDDEAAMEDPFQSISIQNGILEVKFQLFYSIGGWEITNTTYKFRYQNEKFVLIGADKYSIHRGTHDFEEHSYNFLTGKHSSIIGNEDSGSKKTTWKTMKRTVLKTLEDFKAPFIWEVGPGVLL